MSEHKKSGKGIANLGNESINVLLVDDDKEFLNIEKIFLERENSRFNIIVFDSAEEALKHLEENHIDVIVSDYMMPDMDGLTFLREIREERHYDTPFILMTGQGREEVAIQALNLGANSYLQKGGDPKSQFGVLAKAIVQEVTHHRTEKLLELTKHSVEKASHCIYWIDKDGRFVYVNDAAVKKLGYTPEEFLHMNVWDIDPHYPKDMREGFWNQLKQKGNMSIETTHRTKDGKEFSVAVTCNHILHEGRELEFAFAEDITHRKQSETLTEMNRKTLQCLNEPLGLQESIEGVLKILKDYTGFDAIGIRLKSGDDYPYFVHEGFSEEFIKTENSLVKRDQKGDICRDENGKVCLECTCGLVLSGHTDPTNPIFTEGGSAWTNDSNALLESPSHGDLRINPRNECIHQGYASIAIVPIRKKDQIVGLIQFNHRNVGAFDKEMIKQFEIVASSIGSGIARVQAEEENRFKSILLKTQLENSPDGILIADEKQKILSYNQHFVDMWGVTDAMMDGSSVTEVWDYVLSKIQSPLDLSKDIEELERNAHITTQDELSLKDSRVLELYSVPLWGDDNDHHGRAWFFRDITERKRAEKEIRYREELGRIITEVSTSLINVELKEIDHHIEIALERIGEFADAARSYVFLFDDEIERMDNTYEWCAEGVVSQKEGLQDIPTDDFPWVMEKLKALKSVPIQNASDLPPEAQAEKEHFRHQRIDSLLIVPMVSNRRLKGFIGYDDVEGDVFSEDIIDLMRVVGDGIASALDRKEQETKLHQSEEHLSATLQSIGDGVISTDDRGMVTNMNSVAEKLCGWTLDEAIGKKISDVFHIVNAKTRERVGDPVKHVLRSGKTVGLANHTLLISKEGSEYQIADSAAPIKATYGETSGVVMVFRDVTEEYAMAEKLRESEERFQKMLSLVPDMISIHDTDMNIVYSNWNGFGAVPEEKRVLNTKCYRTYRGFDDICPDCQAVKVLETGEAIQKEVELPEDKWVDLRVIPIYGPDGSIKYIVEWVQDITEMKGYVAELKRKEMYLESAPIYVLVLDDKGSIKYHSYPSDDVTGFDLSQIMGEDVFDFAHPDDLEKVINVFSDSIEEPGKEQVVEVRGKMKEGWAWFMVKVVNLLDDPDIEGIIITAEDINERKRIEEEMVESREKYQSLVDNLPGITYRCRYDKNWTMLYMSDAVDPFIGYPSSDFVQNEVRTYESVIHPDDTDSVQKDIKMAVEEGKPWDIRYRVIRKDGDVRWVHERGKAVFGEEGEVEHLDGLILDITERKRTEELLAILYEETSRVNRLMSGREDRVIELKEEVNKLARKLGQEAVYKSVED